MTACHCRKTFGQRVPFHGCTGDAVSVLLDTELEFFASVAKMTKQSHKYMYRRLQLLQQSQTNVKQNRDNNHGKCILRVLAETHRQTRTVSVAALDALPKLMDESCLHCHCHNHHLHK